eukprot:12416470-Prorocentrum_lima.AAC.1
MTSSLVGSEMCIRDRTRTSSGSNAWILWTRASWISTKDMIQGSSRGPSPVSYTHLTLPTICSV